VRGKGGSLARTLPEAPSAMKALMEISSGLTCHPSSESFVFFSTVSSRDARPALPALRAMERAPAEESGVGEESRCKMKHNGKAQTRKNAMRLNGGDVGRGGRGASHALSMGSDWAKGEARCSSNGKS